ncbi:hypothetical protein ACFLUJ_05240 [Chloroflexota bacterium]
MKWRDFTILLLFVVVALLFGIIGWITLSPVIKWIAPAVALGLISIGLGANGISMAHNVDKNIKILNTAIIDIQQTLEKIQKEHNEEANSSSPVVESLQALSQYYIDYLAKESGEQNSEKS